MINSIAMTLNLLQRSLIEKSGYENGFENNMPLGDSGVCLSSARHTAEVVIRCHSDRERLWVSVESNNVIPLLSELIRIFSNSHYDNNAFLLSNFSELAIFLQRTASLAHSLPNQAVDEFRKDFAEAIKDLPNIKGTEAERLIKQRIGQDRFRNAMLNYWDGGCAVTGITVTEVLRASHAKPWAECISDDERLDVFNGFLLCANLDALFDRFLILFDGDGKILISSRISQAQRESLNLEPMLKLRWTTTEHKKYLNFHRSIFETLS